MLNRLLCITYFVSSIIVLMNNFLPRVLLREVAVFLMLKGLLWIVLYKKMGPHEWLNLFFGIYIMMLGFNVNIALLTGMSVVFLTAEFMYHSWLKAYISVE